MLKAFCVDCFRSRTIASALLCSTLAGCDWSSLDHAWVSTRNAVDSWFGHVASTVGLSDYTVERKSDAFEGVSVSAVKTIKYEGLTYQVHLTCSPLKIRECLHGDTNSCNAGAEITLKPDAEFAQWHQDGESRYYGHGFHLDSPSRDWTQFQILELPANSKTDSWNYFPVEGNTFYGNQINIFLPVVSNHRVDKLIYRFHVRARQEPLDVDFDYTSGSLRSFIAACESSEGLPPFDYAKSKKSPLRRTK